MPFPPSRLCPLPDSHKLPKLHLEQECRKSLLNADSDSAGQDRGLSSCISNQCPVTGAHRCPPSLHPHGCSFFSSQWGRLTALFREAFPGHRLNSVPPQHPAHFLHSRNRDLSLAFMCLLLTVGGCHSLSPTDCVFYTHTPLKPLPVVTLGLATSSACDSDLQNCKIIVAWLKPARAW